jgi:hypothetical protein
MAQNSLWHNVRRVIGLELIMLGHRIYPHRKDRMILTACLAAWADQVAKGKE